MSSQTMEPEVKNVDGWISENRRFFLPPVCNKMMHNDGQMKLFFVGGPNERKDYHIEEGEELFYMIKGDMVLKVVERGKHKDIPIRQGEIFLLPGRIPHSPQRIVDTVGLVIERERDEKEMDGLRYFVEKNNIPTTESLFEEWFNCVDLGSQLGPIIKKFFSSQQFETGQPVPGTISLSPPVTLDNDRELEKPFSLSEWIEKHKAELDTKGSISLFDSSYQFEVLVCGEGVTSGVCDQIESWIWQFEGNSTVIIDEKEYPLAPQDSILIKAGQKYTFRRSERSVALFCKQDPARKLAN